MWHHRRVVTASLAVLLVLPASAWGQSAGELVRDALRRYEQRMEGVENYTVIQEVMGFETATRFERREIEGESVFVVARSRGSEVPEGAPRNYRAMLQALGERASLEGAETVDGEECHVFSVTDFSGGAFGQYAPPESAGEWTPVRLRLFLDREELLPRKMVFEGEVAREGETTSVTLAALMRDYREVDGVVHPFTMEVHTEGVTPAMTPRERAEMEASMRRLKEQMADMPPQQREMAEETMGGQLEKMEEMLSSGAMDFTVRVTEVRVNGAPPPGG